MALINCPVCGEKVSDKAVKCVHCGSDISKKDDGIVVKCISCGEPLADEQAFCTKCGTPRGGKGNRILTCAKCASQLKDGEVFCPKCGFKVGANEIREGNNDIRKKRTVSPKIVVAIALCLIAVAVVVISINGGLGKKDFNDMYGDLSDYSWCTIASDGSYMRIDTNPRDIDNDDFDLDYYNSIWEPSNDAIKRVNKELGFSDALLEKMNSTTWSQGKQIESNDKYIVSWTYHPDKGLEVMYELK